MQKIAETSRLISLAVLFGGSAAVVFVAIVLVKAAKANGVEVSEAAFRNGPAFIQFGKVAAGAAIVLLGSEVAHFLSRKKKAMDKPRLLRYVLSFLCATTALIFAFGIVPPMEKLLPSIRTDQEAHAKFHKLHETSRAVFGASIVFALLSLITPPLSKREED